MKTVFLSTGWCVVTALLRCGVMRANVNALGNAVKRTQGSTVFHQRPGLATGQPYGLRQVA